MAQTPANRLTSEGNSIPYTAGSAVTGGDVILVGTRPLIATSDIAAGAVGTLATEGIFAVPKATGDTFAVGDYVYWDVDGTPVTGTALSGAGDSSSGAGYALGYATEAAASGDDYVYVNLTAQVGPTTVTSMTTIAAAVVAADGSAQGDAAAIVAGFTHATGADGTKGVKLPAAAAGAICIVKNSDAANAVLKVYPSTSDAINAIAADGAISMGAKTSAMFIAIDSTTWYTIPLLPS